MVLAVLGFAYSDEGVPIALYPLLPLTALVVLWMFRRSYDELREPAVANARELVVAVAAGLLVLAVWAGVDSPWLRLPDSKGYAPVDAAGHILWGWAAIRIAGSAIVVPVMEELFWRNFVMRWLDESKFLGVLPAAITWRAVVISSAAFALEHTELFAGAVAGLAYALLYRHSGRLWPAIIAHGVTNLGLGVWIMTTRQWNYW